MIFYSTKKEKHILEIKEDGIYLYEEAAEDITESLSRMTFSETKDQPRRVLLQKITLIGSGYDLVFSLVDAIVNRSLQVGFNFENDTYANNLRIIFCLLVPYVNSSLSFQYDIFHFITDLLLRKTKPIVLENNKVYIYRNKKNVLMYSTAKTGEVTLEDMPKTKSDKISTKKDQKLNDLISKDGEIKAVISIAEENGHLKYFSKKSEDFDIDDFIAIKRFLDENSPIKEKIQFINIKKRGSIDAALSEALELYASDDSDSEAEISEKNDETSPPSDFIYSIRNHKREEREEIEEAQNKINKFLISRDPEVDSLEVEGESIKIKGKSLNVLFCIPGFRGVNHMPLRFSDEVRRLYRSREFQGKRVKLPYYSEAAQMSRFDFYRDINGAQVHLTETLDDENRTVLDANSHQLEELLLKMRDEDYILVKGLSGKIKLFSNYLHFLQHLYSNGIIKSQRFLREVLSRQLGPQLPNAYNPFVSESETAEHALRYGFGLKSLYQSAALHAHYHLDGKPAFPYLGEIHLSLRGMDVFSSSRERHQIRRLEKMYRVNPTMMIGPEMESTGFGWLPAGEVIYSETIKCPNFKGKWKNKYKEKFGLSKKKFNEFKSNILDSDRKEERMQIEVEIINHLIKHYSNILLKKVVEIAKTRNEILVFLDSDGNISFDLPERDMRNDADAEAKEMREQLEATLEKLCTDSTQEIEVELNSKKMVIYRISPKAFNKAVKDIDDVDHFLMEDEKLRTPLSQVSTPRTSLSSKSRNSSIVFSLSGSAGTPLSHRGFFTSKAVGHDVEEYFDSLTTAQHSNEWYDDESINTLLRHYFPINQHKVKVLDVLPLEGDITHELIRTRLNGEFEKNITTYYLPLRINANHWIGLYIDRTVGNPQIWWIDPYGGISLKRQKEIVTILNQTGLFDIELALNHVHFQPYQLQTDGHNCGPWVIEILRFIRETGGFPDDQSINIVDRRQEHLLITNPGNAHEITDTTSSGTSSTTIYKNITIWTKNSEPTKVESGEIIVEICPEMPTSSTNLASKS